MTKPDSKTIQKLAADTGIQSQWNELKNTGCPYCNDTDNVYILDDGKTCYCLECENEFTLLSTGEIITDGSEDYLSSEFADANKAAAMLVDSTKNGQTETKTYLPGFQPKTGEQNWNGCGYSTYHSTPSKPVCTHYPTHVIAGRGWDVFAGKKWDVEKQLNRFDVVLNLQFTAMREQRVIPIPELKHWENYGQTFEEIQIDWPDYGISTLPRKFWEELVTYLRTNKKRMLVFCVGGHGRTGTAVATLMVVALGWSAKRAINWVRTNYCSEAIETIGQEKYIQSMVAKREKKAAAKN